MLSVRNLSASFHTRAGIVRAVRNVSFDVAPGETLGIVGESGSGKSVTCYSMMGLIPMPPGRIESGSAMLDGTDLLHCPEKELRSIRGKRISMIFQDPMTSLNPYLTIGEQVAEPLVIHERAGKKEARDRALEQLALVGIPDAEQRMDAYPHQFSGGMRQRVMIAMALITSPEILIADEPTTALDVTVQKQVLDLIRKLQQDMGTSVILITHDLGVVRQYADRINVMYAGRIVESAPARELLEHPRHAYTRALMKSIPGLHAKGSPLYTIPGLPPNMMQEPCGCSFRPRNTLGNPELCLTDREPELVEISPGHSVQNCPGCLAGNQ
ncbi:dipeptide/oligopeptide/nickel ABC transporter ATP-binding protein [Akkermansia muciniphila]|jgi:oligopeptide transport system ATP-binding protein|uniref:ABC transporter ATP-binding protein n=1 Tax=Akkermansia muciniphila TaxID=239935 RepID=UPI000C9AAC61|nr:ABC transporter ATP-binding protein [Akkermansia muciniphila]PNC38091.1 dipeptide/oligopeptide/nickel ABC transporter ATP-binding protein [Akkermansia muciniphila]